VAQPTSRWPLAGQEAAGERGRVSEGQARVYLSLTH
jgi:hypothetical protein